MLLSPLAGDIQYSYSLDENDYMDSWPHKKLQYAGMLYEDYPPLHPLYLTSFCGLCCEITLKQKGDVHGVTCDTSWDGSVQVKHIIERVYL